MASNQRTVDLLIKAKLEGLRDVENVTQAVKGLSKTIDNQTSSLQNNKQAFDALKSAKNGLSAVSNELATLNSLITRYQGVSKSVSELSNKYSAAKDKLDKFNEGLEQTKKPTATQVSQQQRLEGSANKAAEALQEQLKVQKLYADELKTLGVTSDNLAVTQKRLGDAMSQTAASAIKVKNALANMDAASGDLNAIADAEARASQKAQELAKHLKDSAAAAKAVRDGDYIRFWAESLDAADAKALKLKQSAEQLAQAFTRQQKVADSLGQTTNRARIGTDSLSSSQRRLASSIGEVEQSSKRLEPQSRTSLSIYQRIRGQVLGLTSAYVGLFGAINFGSGVIDKFNERQRILTRLSIATGGSLQDAAKEFEYVRKLSDSLGLRTASVGEGYSGLLASKYFAKRDKNEARFAIESIAKLGKVAGLTEEDLKGVFKALTQVDAKGRVMAEEFTGQLGERIPGLAGVAKEVYGGDFLKDMAAGKIGISDFLKVLDAYNKKVGVALPAAMDSLESKQNRLNNAIDDFKVKIGNGGFAGAFADLITQITAFLQSPEGDKFGQGIIETFKALFEIVKVLAPYIKEITTTILYWVGLRFAAGLITDAMSFYGWIKKLSGILATFQATILSRFAATGLVGRIGVFGRWFFGVAGALFVGYEIGNALRSIFPQIDSFAVSVIAKLDRFIIRVKAGFFIMWDSIRSLFAGGLSKLFGGLSTGASKVGLDRIAKNYKALADSYASDFERVNKEAADRLNEYRNQSANSRLTEAEIIKGNANRNKPKAKPAEPMFNGTPLPAYDASGKPTVDDKGAAKIATLIENINNQLNNIESQVQKKTADTLEEKIKGIQSQYKNLMDDIKKVPDKASRQNFTGRLNKARDELIKEATEDADSKILEARTKLWSDLDAIDAEAGKRNATSFAERIAGVPNEVRAKFREQLAEVAKFRKLLDESQAGGNTPASVAQARQDLAVREQGLQTSIKEIEQAAIRTKYLEEAQRQMKALSDLEDARNAKLKILEVQKDSGAITQLQMIERTAELVRGTQPAIDAASASLIGFITNNRAAFGPEAQAQIDEMIAKVGQIKSASEGMRTQIVTARDIAEMLGSSASDSINQAAQAMGNFVAGTGSLRDVLLGVRNSFISFAATFLQKIAMMIIQQRILNALQSFSGSGGILGSIAGAISGAVKHEGGMAGAPTRTRMINPAAFIGAPRYHTGGIAGLAPNEVPAILQKNEEVLTRDDPRHMMNGGGMASAPVMQPQNIKVMNFIDSPSVLSEALSTQEGTKAIINFFRANKTAVKSAMA